MDTRACGIEEIRELLQEYIKGLSSPFDTFHEQYILASQFYIILSENASIGYYAIHDHSLLTQFYLRRPHQRHVQILLRRVLEEHQVSEVFVSTGDELLLSLALDHDMAIAKQAYFFQDSGLDLTSDPGSDPGMLRPAELADLEDIQRVCGDFLGSVALRIQKGELFTCYRGRELLGVGIVERSVLIDGTASIGMFTNELYRHQGIGRSIILWLKAWCHAQGIRPLSGCWYYNEASKRTLESAGMVTRTRLLRMKVEGQEG
ncbi:GNAT family N-acetyltransferase [Paenibacillus cellulositrophicus]|uniref:GNAT family N-acetyltransferase n=1 Tax=Paenibacillus cellulositrophicus TaxID=562959 RepID=UPI0012676F7E|nr:GNAT family N-acetyltransferase [Paenibacillus cellulositrophicus]